MTNERCKCTSLDTFCQFLALVLYPHLIASFAIGFWAICHFGLQDRDDVLFV